jgi:hypothetical protein
LEKLRVSLICFSLSLQSNNFRFFCLQARQKEAAQRQAEQTLSEAQPAAATSPQLVAPAAAAAAAPPSSQPETEPAPAAQKKEPGSDDDVELVFSKLDATSGAFPTRPFL